MKQLLMSISFLMLGAMAFGQKADDIIGIWASNEVNVRVEVYKDGIYYKGKIVYLKDPKDSAGKPKTDIKNHDPKLRSRPMMGLVILEHLEYKDGEWVHGKIYDAESGGHYRCYAAMPNKNELTIRAYMGFSLFGKTVDWYRVK